MRVVHHHPWTGVIALGALSLVACDIDVHNKGKDKGVDIRTAIGDLSVRSSDSGADTGLPVYPGAQPLQEKDNESSSANVSASASGFGMHVAAAKFRSSDAPTAIVAFYKDKMSTYGSVVECHGDVDFDDESKQPVCKDDSGSNEIQLVTGTERSHRVVAVKPRGDGSEFAVASIQIDERS